MVECNEDPRRFIAVSIVNFTIFLPPDLIINCPTKSRNSTNLKKTASIAFIIIIFGKPKIIHNTRKNNVGTAQLFELN